jgi:mannose-6-phosphate isomerase-like protein (cupin superfamily)
MGYHVIRGDNQLWEQRSNPPGRESQPQRSTSDITTQAALTQSRARLWRYPCGAWGRPHAEKVQEEVFVVISGTLTMLLGEPPERVELPPESVVSVEPGTPLQVRNDGDEDVHVFIYGVPPVPPA